MGTDPRFLARAKFDLPAGTVHALVGGDDNAPPLVYLHGFPDHPPTAQRFLAELTRTHRVVAPWLRGYAPSPTSGPFRLAALADDVAALIDQLGGRADLVGHDWGAAITYRTCTRSPHAVRRAVTLALPHPWTFVRSLRHAAQRRASWYMFLFQVPGAGYLAPRLIDRLWAQWSPGFALDADARRALHACLAESMPGPIAYYRALFRPTLRELREVRATVPTPLLQLHGDDDGCVLAASAAVDDAALFISRQREIVSGGHFLHIEDPLAIAARIQRFLA